MNISVRRMSYDFFPIKFAFSHQIPQAVTFLLDALKSYQAEGWRLLELQTLRDIAKCYRDVYSLLREC